MQTVGVRTREWSVTSRTHLDEVLGALDLVGFGALSDAHYLLQRLAALEERERE
jgi:hypothetical protein